MITSNNINNGKILSKSLYVAKGIGIVLVVAGHLHIWGTEPSYWLMLRSAIFQFHMPLFMLLSGCLFAFKEEKVHYFEFIKKKARRLAVPYLTLSLMLLSFKFVGEKFFALHHPVTNNFWRYILLNPYEGFASYLWFIYTLFVIFAIFPLLKNVIIKNDLLFTLVIGTLYFISWPEIFCLNFVFQYMPFFSLGYMMTKYKILEKIQPTAGCIFFFAIFVFVMNLNFLKTNPKLFFLFSGTFGSLMCVFLAQTITLHCQGIATKIKVLGLYSGTIYLLHGMIMSITRIGVLSVINFNTSTYLDDAIVICSAGLLVPILIEKYFLRQQPVLSKLILGVEPVYKKHPYIESFSTN